MSASPVATQTANGIPTRRVRINSESDMPLEYGTTPGGTIFGTTPGGTRIVYERTFLMQLRQSPLARTPPVNLPVIPGVTAPNKKDNKTKNGNSERANGRISPTKGKGVPRKEYSCGRKLADGSQVECDIWPKYSLYSENTQQIRIGFRVGKKLKVIELTYGTNEVVVLAHEVGECQSEEDRGHSSADESLPGLLGTQLNQRRLAEEEAK
eukprot:maker-scaffold539_size142544-snap-gene-0.20 protein:Tk01721 transcript:maker-scaffold539_size142544-snap-gene-0.20-mRNA-1 annotation:"eukaryotic translation initiation factor 4e-binding protein 1-like"